MSLFDVIVKEELGAFYEFRKFSITDFYFLGWSLETTESERRKLQIC